MKKIWKTLLCGVLLALMIILIAACGENKNLPEADGDPPVESALDKEIKAAYIKKHPNENLTGADISLRHYGEFNETYVLIISISGYEADEVETYESADGITYCFAVDESFDVYRAGEFYTLQQAFDSEYLSHDNLYAVWEKHRAENYTLYNGGRVTLNEAEVQEITAATIAAYSTQERTLTAEDIGLRCFGAFDGVYVLFVDISGFGYADVINGETVSGVQFIYSSGHKLSVYSEGEFCSVTEAFEKELLTHEEVLAAQKSYRIGREYLYYQR